MKDGQESSNDDSRPRTKNLINKILCLWIHNEGKREGGREKRRQGGREEGNEKKKEV